MPPRIQLLPGTLEMLVLQTLVFGPRHGHGIVIAIQRGSEDSLLVDHGSLYPALQRLEQSELIVSEWGVSDNNRRAKFYTLTAAGRKRLREETESWNRNAAAIAVALKARPSEG
jgi:PadR family transcriptional regulator